MTEEKKIEWEEVKGGDIWLPEKEGEVLQGFVLRKEEGEHGDFWIIQDKDGKETRTPSHRVLQSRMSQVEPGKDVVRITFVREELPKVKGHSGTRIYKVEVARPKQ